LLIGLTGSLFLLPTRIVLPDNFHPVQSLLLYEPFRTFAVLYVAWITLLVALLTTARSGNKQHWEQLALLLVFAVGFLYYWITKTPWGRLWDEPYQLAIAQQVYDLGTVSGMAESLPYVRWPASHNLGAMLMHVAEIGLLEMRNFLALANILLTTGLLYLFLVYCVGGSKLASLGVIMAIQSNPIIIKMSFFFPQTFGITFLLLLMVLIPRCWPEGANKTWLALTILVFAVLTATHAITALAFALILVGVYVVGRLWQISDGLHTGFAGLLAAIWGAWLLYSGFDVFRAGVIGLSHLLSGDVTLLDYMLRTAKLKVLVADYWWAVLTRGVWLSLTWVVGPALWLYLLLRSRPGHRQELLFVGGMLGVFLTTFVVAAVSPGGHQAFRYQLYGPIFAVPLLLTAACHISPRPRMFLVAGAWLGVASLSLPSLLVFNNSVLFDATYRQEWSAAHFVSSNVIPVQSSSIVIPSTVLEGPYYLYSPRARPLTPLTLEKLEDSSEFFAALDRHVVAERSGITGSISRTVVWSRKLPLLGKSAFGIDESDYRWLRLHSLFSNSDVVYQNGLMELFRSSP
jgi:hypothetical protein